MILICQISIVLAESALEIIPKELRNNYLILNYLKKVGKFANEVLLDKSYHYNAMREENIDFIWKRGRPDLVHICLMSILSTPLFLRNLVNVYVHTIDNKVIFIGEHVRLPKSFRRFEGLMIKLFQEKEIKEENLKDDNRYRYLLKIEENMTFDILLAKVIQPHKVIGFSSTGILKDLKTIVNENIEIDNKKVAFIVGGFQSGQFSQNIREKFHMTYAIANEQLEAHVVISRLVYECENRLSLLYGHII
ncbi:MAG TPA: ribosome biogenesis protein [Nitrososphaeraceae archaeon]|nr:ribosome biogenesis protein [Nitrososphaeraceae archaeon]